jgi:hypothetical protein
LLHYRHQFVVQQQPKLSGSAGRFQSRHGACYSGEELNQIWRRAASAYRGSNTRSSTRRSGGCLPEPSRARIASGLAQRCGRCSILNDLEIFSRPDERSGCLHWWNEICISPDVLVIQVDIGIDMDRSRERVWLVGYRNAADTRYDDHLLANLVTSNRYHRATPRGGAQRLFCRALHISPLGIRPSDESPTDTRHDRPLLCTTCSALASIRQTRSSRRLARSAYPFGSDAVKFP